MQCSPSLVSDSLEPHLTTLSDLSILDRSLYTGCFFAFASGSVGFLIPSRLKQCRAQPFVCCWKPEASSYPNGMAKRQGMNLSNNSIRRLRSQRRWHERCSPWRGKEFWRTCGTTVLARCLLDVYRRVQVRKAKKRKKCGPEGPHWYLQQL